MIYFLFQDGLCDVVVHIDGQPHGTINGLAQFTKQAYVGVGMWTRQGHLVDIEDPFNLPLSRSFVKTIQ